jgi:hypothetical protein
LVLLLFQQRKRPRSTPGGGHNATFAWRRTRPVKHGSADIDWAAFSSSRFSLASICCEFRADIALLKMNDIVTSTDIGSSAAEDGQRNGG